MSVKTMQIRLPGLANSEIGEEPIGWANASRIAAGTSETGSSVRDVAMSIFIMGGGSKDKVVLL
jgi:hypothetical protein